MKESILYRYLNVVHTNTCYITLLKAISFYNSVLLGYKHYNGGLNPPP